VIITNNTKKIHQSNKLDKKRNRKYEDRYQSRKNILFIILKIRYKMKV